jgi:hypothetical protein
MTAERESILTTIKPADRIPSVGTQLTVEPEPEPYRDQYARYGAVPPRGPAQPERLTLWDQSADLWSE